MQDIYTESEKKHMKHLLRMASRMHNLEGKDGQAASTAFNAYMNQYEEMMSLYYKVLHGVKGLYNGEVVTIDEGGSIGDDLTTYVYTEEQGLIALDDISYLVKEVPVKQYHITKIEDGHVYTDKGYFMSVDDFFNHWDGAVSLKNYDWVSKETILNDFVLNHDIIQRWDTDNYGIVTMHII